MIYIINVRHLFDFRQLKEEADSRISDICAGTPTRKDEAHKRMTNIVNRCHSKENVLKEKLDVTRGEDLKCDQQLGELLKKNPQLQASYDLEMEKLSKIALKYKVMRFEIELFSLLINFVAVGTESEGKRDFNRRQYGKEQFAG